MNSPYVAIVPLYTLVVVIRGWYWFADFARYDHTYFAVCVVAHNGMDPGAAIVTPRNSCRFLTIPLSICLILVHAKKGNTCRKKLYAKPRKKVRRYSNSPLCATAKWCEKTDSSFYLAWDHHNYCSTLG